MNTTLITSYTHPDLDAVSCIYAYVELLTKQGKDAEGKIFGIAHDEVQYVCNQYNIKCPASITNAKDWDKIILVDASDIGGLDKSINYESVVEIIDHRMQNESHLFENAALQIEKVGAAATLVAEKFHQSNIEPSVQSAVLLYGAIVSNTLNFKAKVTTDRDHAMAKWLSQFIHLPETFAHDMFAAKSNLTGPLLQQRMVSDFAWFTLGGKRESIIQLEILDADKLIESRMSELLQELHRFRDEMHLEVFFISLIDLLADRNFFVADDRYTQQLLEDIFAISFKDNVAVHPGLIMRKEITPLLREKIEDIARGDN